MTDSVSYRLLPAIVEKLQGLGLAGLTSDQIVWSKHPWNPKDIPTQGIHVSPVGESVTAKTNLSEDIGYGVQVVYFSTSNRDQTSNLSRTLKWRHTISRALRHQAIAGVEEVYDVRIEPGPVIELGAFKDQYDAGAITLRCIARETHGV